MAASKIWKIADKISDDLVKQLLVNRGLKTKTEIEKFFNPKLLDYEKDLNIPGIEKTHQRIKKAIKSSELIIVFGDYDIDGICASTILYKALTSIGAKVLPYIPHREKEGYGLNKLGLDFAKQKEAGLVITVDNGIVALEQAKYAKSLGLDLIITDHHLPLDSLPEAYEIIHSTKMCGAAVAWCLIRELVKKELSDDLLQFAAIATVGDLIPLVDLGRAFVVEGLKSLQNSNNPGLNALASCCSVSLKEVGTYEIGHILGPRLNAIGRLEHALDALRLLCTNDRIKARKLADLLCDMNIRRQQLTEVAINDAGMLISQSGNGKIHIVDSREWPAGIIGLVAARICEQYSVPAIALSVGDSFAKGSARSVNGLNIVEVIRECSDILIDVGGHKGAAGFSILNEKIPEFKDRLEKIIDKHEFNQEKVLEIEAVLEKKELSKKLVNEIEKFAPFGFGNPQPLLMSSNFQISEIRTLKEGKHLKFKASGIDAIAFNMGEWGNILKEGNFVDLVYYLEINKFNGSENLQLKVRDIKLR